MIGNLERLVKLPSVLARRLGVYAVARFNPMPIDVEALNLYMDAMEAGEEGLQDG